MSFLKGLLKYAAPALSMAAPFFPPLAAAGPLVQGLTKAGLAGAGAALAGGGGGGAPTPELPQPITADPTMTDPGPAPRPVPGAVAGPQPMQPPQGGPDLNGVDYKSLLAKPQGHQFGNALGLLGGGLAGHFLKKLF